MALILHMYARNGHLFPDHKYRKERLFDNMQDIIDLE